MPLVPLKRLPSAFEDDAPAPPRRPILVARSRPAAGTEATQAEAAARWENLATDFPDLIRAEVDLVEELESILRGDIDATDADFLRRPDPCDDETALEAPTALDTLLADPWDEEPAQPLNAADPTAMRLGTWETAEAATRAPSGTDEQRFWRAGNEGNTARMIRDRRHRSPRTDVVVISALVLLVAGVGAYAGFRDWTPDDATATPVAQTEAPVTGVAGIVGADAAAAAPPAVANELAPAAATPAAAAAEAAMPAAPAVTPDPFAAEPRTVAVVPVPADNIPPTPPAEAAAPPVDALAATPPPAAPGDRVDQTPQPIDLLNQTPLAEAPATPPTPAPAEPAAAAPVPAAPVAAPAPAPRAQAPARAEAPAPAAVATAPPTGGTVAVANTWVNMRSGASSGSPVVRVVSPGTAVTVVSCDGWCEVVVDGTTGWIYQDFLRTNR